MKPILFNTEMARAILDGRKTLTRRVVKLPSNVKKQGDGLFTLFTEGTCYENNRIEDIVEYLKQPFKVNDILYVRETWCSAYDGEEYFYLADKVTVREKYRLLDYNNVKWRPSIHMPKKAARIFLKVTGVRVERLQDMRLDDFKNEGTIVTSISPEDDLNYRFNFSNLWDATIKKDQLQYYSWGANPYVWVIEFEVIDKAAALKEE